MAKTMLKIINFVIGIGLLWVSPAAFSVPHKPLPIDQCFKFSATVKDPQTIIAEWHMAPGYYLYRQYLTVSTTTPDIKLGPPHFPKGVSKTEPEIGTFEIYPDKLYLPIPVISHKQDKVELTVHYQGCSQDGFCYPPTDKHITLDLSKAMGVSSELNNKEPIAQKVETPPLLPDSKELIDANSEQEKASQLLSSGHYLTIIASFLGFGLLLAFTPCVLPMIPILSGIILGQNRVKLTTGRAFSFSLVYVLSMSITYAVAGILIGYIGGSVQAAFQKPWMLAAFSLLFVALAFSFFGLYEIKLPERLQTSLSNASKRQKSGSYIGVAIMGCLATLIVSPCVTPALVGALSYIGKSGNAILGGIALFCLGFGMGIPLLLIGTAGAKLLPKAGIWMDRVKFAFGFLLLGMAIFMADRILPAPIILFLYGCVCIFTAIYMNVFTLLTAGAHSRLSHGAGTIFLVYGILLLIGATMGHTNPLQPLSSSSTSIATTAVDDVASFRHVADEEEVSNAIKEAVNQNKIVMLDFTAKWCTSCKIMEHRTFNDPEVTKTLHHFVTLKADVTNNDPIVKRLQQKYQVIAPPTLLFFDSNGHELEKFRVVGEMGPKEFLDHLQTVIKAGQ
jgi:thiol:disulfide interchange protein DsbD